MALSGTEELGVYAEQEESDVADVDTEEEEADVDLTFPSSSSCTSSSLSSSVTSGVEISNVDANDGNYHTQATDG